MLAVFFAIRIKIRDSEFMMFLFFSQLYGFSFGCKANADQRDLGLQALGQEMFPSIDQLVKPPVKPSVCHFSEFYNPDEYNGGCTREERRMNIVEDAVQKILTDYSDELVSLLYADFDEAQGMAF